MKANTEIREAMKRASVKQWQLAKLTGCSEQTIYRRLRIELSDIEKQRYIELIERERRD